MVVILLGTPLPWCAHAKEAVTMTQWGLDTLFNPAKRHMDDEKRRLQSTREEIGDASGGRRIDLDSGKVTVSGADVTAADEQVSDEPPAHETAAQARARVRRQAKAKPPKSAPAAETPQAQAGVADSFEPEAPEAE
jgi:hypothetical protein